MLRSLGSGLAIGKSRVGITPRISLSSCRWTLENRSVRSMVTLESLKTKTSARTLLSAGKRHEIGLLQLSSANSRLFPENIGMRSFAAEKEEHVAVGSMKPLDPTATAAAAASEQKGAEALITYYEGLVKEKQFSAVLSHFVSQENRGELAQNTQIQAVVFQALLEEISKPENIGKLDAIQKLLQGKPEVAAASTATGTQANPLYVTTMTTWPEILLRWGGLLLTVVLIYVIFFSRGVSDLGSLVGKPNVSEHHMSNTKLEDVKGNEEAKEELADIVEYLRSPTKFGRLGAKVNKGVLLIGPPGCGKTLLARSLAGEAGVPFFYASGSEFEEMFVGLGAKRMRDLFKKARQMSPCIIFIDEIDAVGGRRDINESRTKLTLNQLLTELDGFNQTDGVIVIAATNSPDVLDPALVRPGRFNRKVLVDYPDVKARKDILDLYIGDRGAPDVDTLDLAKQTIGFSGAALNDMVNTATIDATKKSLSKIPMHTLVKAKETTSMGPERRSLEITPEVKRITAYHEAGHAIVGLYTKGGHPLVKATLVPRGSALGVTYYLPTEEKLTTKESMLGSLDCAMGGRVAEEMMFGDDKVTQGASNDFEQATKIAQAMIASYGMGKNLGKMAFSSLGEMSAKTRSLIDDEVKSVLDLSYVRAQNLLQKRKKELILLAEALLEYETLSAREIDIVIKGGDIKSAMKRLADEEQLLVEKEKDLFFDEGILSTRAQLLELEDEQESVEAVQKEVAEVKAEQVSQNQRMK